MKAFFLTLLPAFLVVLGASAQSTKDTITTPSGLKYVQIKAGKGEMLKDGQKIKVYYTGKFMNGKQFETNRDDKPFKFTLGTGEVIPGWDEGFKLMKAGEEGILIIPANLAYGKSGVKDFNDERVYHIPPNSDLIFEVEIVNAK